MALRSPPCRDSTGNLRKRLLPPTSTSLKPPLLGLAATSRFAIGPSQLHISLTDKSFVYGTALQVSATVLVTGTCSRARVNARLTRTFASSRTQLALSRGVQSAVPALSGVIAGLLYRANVARLGDFRVRCQPDMLSAQSVRLGCTRLC